MTAPLRTLMSDAAVFVQTAAPDGNAVVSHRRDDNGMLSRAARYATGGRGGALDGAVADHLASQGSLAYDESRGILYAVDAGSNALVCFRADGDRLDPPRRMPSGGGFPVSVALHDDLVYVLNGRDGGSIQGYRHRGDDLMPLDQSHRELDLDTMAMPEFTHTPGQVGFTPDGRHLVVTTKADDAILVFPVEADGCPAPMACRNERPGSVPFGFLFTPTGHLVVAEAGTNSLSSFAVQADGSLLLIDTMRTGQSATCWVSGTGQFLFASNAGSASVTSMRIADDGHLSMMATTPTSPGSVDSAVSSDGRFLYVQAGGVGAIDELVINDDGSLTMIGSVIVEGARGGEGIIAR